MNQITNDYEADSNFGRWLRDQRVCMGLTLEQTSLKTGITISRLKALEMGYAERGITHGESEKISAAYKLVLREILSRAAGSEA